VLSFEYQGAKRFSVLSTRNSTLIPVGLKAVARTAIIQHSLAFGALSAMETYVLILISTVFVNNIVMSKILGLCPFMGVSKNLETAVGMGAATAFVLTLASGTSYLINEYLLGDRLFYLRTISFIVVIAGIVGFTEMFVKKASPVLFRVLGIYLPLITTNCAVLGIPLLNVQAQHGFAESLFFGMGGAIGFTMVLVLFAAMRERLEAADVPAPFRGTSIAMISAGLMSLAFMGFSGLVK
jgi:electron transport complex protein RnfA